MEELKCDPNSLGGFPPLDEMQPIHLAAANAHLNVLVEELNVILTVKHHQMLLLYIQLHGEAVLI